MYAIGASSALQRSSLTRPKHRHQCGVCHNCACCAGRAATARGRSLAVTPVAFRETPDTDRATHQAKQQAMLSRRGMAVAEKKVRQPDRAAKGRNSDSSRLATAPGVTHCCTESAPVVARAHSGPQSVSDIRACYLGVDVLWFRKLLRV